MKLISAAIEMWSAILELKQSCAPRRQETNAVNPIQIKVAGQRTRNCEVDSSAKNARINPPRREAAQMEKKNRTRIRRHAEESCLLCKRRKIKIAVSTVRPKS